MINFMQVLPQPKIDFEKVITTITGNSSEQKIYYYIDEIKQININPFEQGVQY